MYLFPPPRLARWLERHKHWHSWTNPTPPRRTGPAAYPGSRLKHCSLLFHVRGSFFQQLATKDPAALEKQGWEGALRDKDAQHSKRYAALLGSPQKCSSPHHPVLTAISRYGNQGTEGGGQTFPTWASFSNISYWNQEAASCKLALLLLFVWAWTGLFPLKNQETQRYV